MDYTRLLSRIKGSKISENVIIKSFCRVYYSEIGSYTYIGQGSIINQCKIGKYCSIAMNAKIGMGRHPTDYISTSPLFYTPNNPFKVILVKDTVFKECYYTMIGSDVWIGVDAIIKDGLDIGHGAIIAAGSVVTKNIPPYAIVGGVPAKVIKYRYDKQIIDELLALKWWEWELSKIEKIKKLFCIKVTKNIVDELKEYSCNV